MSKVKIYPKCVCALHLRENLFLTMFHEELLLNYSYTHILYYIILYYYWNYSSSWFLILGNKVLEDRRGRQWEDVIRG